MRIDMNQLKLATTIEHELFDGSKVGCTFAMYRLKRMASERKDLHDVAIKVISKGTEDVFEAEKALYAAYYCANIDDPEKLTEEEFSMMNGSDYAGIMETIAKLVNPKNRKASGNPSN